MRRPAIAALALSASLAGLFIAGPAAGAANNQVGPRQAFVGRVNGSFSDAIVKVLCPGPGGLKGHPLSGQQLAVLSPPPPVAVGIMVSVGRTGMAAKAIVARFSDDPSVATTFHQYFVDMPIPTGLLLPCSGRGKVVFRPAPSSRSARPSVVWVQFVNLGV